MKKIVIIACMLLLLLSALASAGELNQKTVSEVVEKIKAGKKVSQEESYPSDQTQVFAFTQRWPITNNMSYYIDIRAKLCYVGVHGGSVVTGLSPIPCKSLKDGYPLIAPIIDWEK